MAAAIRLVAALATLVFFSHLNGCSTSNHHNGNHDTWDITTAIPGYPRPHSSHNRILGMILAFNFNRIESILIALQEYKNMCEAGWMPSIHFITATTPSERLQRYFENKNFCYRIQRSIPMVYRQYNGSEKFLLSEHNRECVSEQLQNHDLFIYQEEDTILTLSHIMAYLDETKRLVHAAYNAEKINIRRSLSSTASSSSSIRDRDSKGNIKVGHFRRKPLIPPMKNTAKEPKIDWEFANNTLREYMIGFQRFYRVRSANLNKMNNESVTDNDIFRSEQLNEIPFLYPVCVHDQPYLESRSSSYRYIAQPHQAVYVMTRHQVHLLQEKCRFLDQRITNLKNEKFLDYAREYTSSLSLFQNNIITHHSCNLKKLTPAERMMSLSIEHLRPTFTERPDHPLHIVDEHVTTGLVQNEFPVVRAGYYDTLPCWKEVLDTHRKFAMLEVESSPVLASVPRRHEIYLVEKGSKRLIKDMGTFNKHGFSLDNITQQVFAEALLAMPNGPQLG